MQRYLTPVVVFMMVVFAGPAFATPKVALLEIEGDSSGSMRDTLIEILDGDDLTMIGKREVNRATDGVEAADLQAKDAKRLGKQLEADAIVYATLGKKGANKSLKFKLFVKGKKARGFTVIFVSAKSAKFKRELSAKLVSLIDKSGSGDDEDDDKGKKATKDKDDDDDDDDDKGKKAKNESSKGDQDEDDDDDKPRRKKVASDDDDDDDDELSARASLRKTSGHTANRVAARVDAGVSVANRQYIFNTQNFEGRPKGFKSAPVPGARFELELFPIAFANPKSFASGLGFAADYDKTLALNLQSSGDDAGKKFPVKQQSYSFGGRFRIVFGRSATAPSTTLGVNYGRRTFTVNRAAITNPMTFFDVPDTDYKFISPSLAFRIPFAASFALIADGNVMAIRDAGPIQKPSSFGQAKVLGFGGQAGFDITFANRFALRLVGEFTQIGYAFTGTGDLSNNLDDDMQLDVGGLADRSFGGSATLGVLY